MADPLIITPVAPIGRSIHLGFGHLADGSPVYAWEADDYPPSPEGKSLRDERRRLDMGLRQAAKALGISAAQLSSLETGQATCDWEVARKMLLAPKEGGERG